MTNRTPYRISDPYGTTVEFAPLPGPAALVRKHDVTGRPVYSLPCLLTISGSRFGTDGTTMHEVQTSNPSEIRTG